MCSGRKYELKVLLFGWPSSLFLWFIRSLETQFEVSWERASTIAQTMQETQQLYPDIVVVPSDFEDSAFRAIRRVCNLAVFVLDEPAESPNAVDRMFERGVHAYVASSGSEKAMGIRMLLLLLALRTVGQDVSPQDGAIMSWGDLALDVAGKTLWCGNKRERLSAQELFTFSCLVEHDGGTYVCLAEFAKSERLQVPWQVRNTVNALRAKFRVLSTTAEIETSYAKGYRLVAAK